MNLFDLKGPQFINGVRALVGLDPIPNGTNGRGHLSARASGLSLVPEHATMSRGCRRVGPGGARFPWGRGMSDA